MPKEHRRSTDRETSHKNSPKETSSRKKAKKKHDSKRQVYLKYCALRVNDHTTKEKFFQSYRSKSKKSSETSANDKGEWIVEKLKQLHEEKLRKKEEKR